MDYRPKTVSFYEINSFVDSDYECRDKLRKFLIMLPLGKDELTFTKCQLTQDLSLFLFSFFLKVLLTIEFSAARRILIIYQFGGSVNHLFSMLY